MKISAKIKGVRNKLGYTQQQFADENNISRSSLSQIEIGKVNPTYELIMSIVKNYGIDANYLINDNVSKDNLKDKKNNTDKSPQWYDENGNKVNLPFNPNLLNDSFDKELEKNIKKLYTLKKQILSICIVLKENGISFTEKEKILFTTIEEALDENFTIVRMLDKERKEYLSHLKNIINLSENTLNIYIDVLQDFLGKPIRDYEDLFK